jgi:glycine cleavage system transcriptional repressor
LVEGAKLLSKSVVLTGVGRDRVGIVAELTQVLFELGCNLLDSSMTLLRGEFAIILMADLPGNVSVAKLQEYMDRLEKQLGMKVHVREMSEKELEEAPSEDNAFIVSVYGADQPGIVARVTKALADDGMNITDVQTKSTAKDGDRVFVMVLEVVAPSGTPRERVEKPLSSISRQLKVDIAVQPLDVVEF